MTSRSSLVCGVGLLVALGTCGCDSDVPTGAPVPWKVYRAASVPDAIVWTADDLGAYLGAMGREVTDIVGEELPGCARGEGRVVLVGDGLGDVAALGVDATDQTFGIEERRCGSGRLVLLRGGGLLGRQYAAYEWLHALGVRYFHPEEEVVPEAPLEPADPVSVVKTPDFTYRSVSLHLTHPLELGDAFSLQDPDHLEEGRRYIDWQIKNLASMGHGGVGSGAYSDYGFRRGFPRGAGLSLHGAQQGSTGGLIDPDDPRPWQQQLEEGVDARMAADPANPPELFSISVGVTEFTEIDDQQAVAELTHFADYMAANYPDVRIDTTAHGTFGDPTPYYGVQFSLLAQFAPTNLGVKVHTLMFYDLFRPAPVYGNTDFNYFFDFMEQEHTTRRLWYFPESAWWLTFDIPVPLYLPITIEARDRDIQGIRHMLSGALEGHRVFGSGHEWGYWQNEYCSLRMSADVDYRYTDCLADITSPMGEAADEVQAAIERVIDWQDPDMFDAAILRYLVGTDGETELAQAVGVVFHPLPPTPDTILGWTQEEVDEWKATIEPRLLEMEGRYVGLAADLGALRDQVPAAALNFFDEIVDGIEIFGVRARHQRQAYGALVTLRDAQLNVSTVLTDQAETLRLAALQSTEAARAIVLRREAGYRYRPLSRAIAGGYDGTGDANWTTYGYRYLNRTHHVFYFAEIDARVEAAFAGASEAVHVDDALLAPSSSLTLQIVAADLSGQTVDYGDGTVEGAMASYSHDYAAPGAYDVVVDGVRAGDPYIYTAPVAALVEEYDAGFTGTVVAPAGAAIIEGILPGLVFGRTTAGRVAVGFSNFDDGTVRPELWVEVDEDLASASSLATVAQDILVPIVIPESGAVVTQVQVLGAVLDAPATSGPVTVTGSMPTDGLVDAVVAVGSGAFNEEGARALVASTLGYTVDTLPATVAATLEYTLP